MRRKRKVKDGQGRRDEEKGRRTGQGEGEAGPAGEGHGSLFPAINLKFTRRAAATGGVRVIYRLARNMDVTRPVVRAEGGGRVA